MDEGSGQMRKDPIGRELPGDYGTGRCASGADCDDPACVKAGHPGVVVDREEHNPPYWCKECRCDHGTVPPVAGAARPDVRGHCPMGCGQTLFLGSGGYITCRNLGCPEPDAVVQLLEVPPETGHIVVFSGDDTFTIQHPVIERLKGELFACELHGYLVSLAGPPVAPGRYRVEKYGQAPYGWSYTETENEMGNDHG
jgi:hypothetical protein